MKPNLNPGGKEAVEKGCTCPILDNGRGNEELGKTRGFWITEGCPLHHKPVKKNITPTSKGDK